MRRTNSPLTFFSAEYDVIYLCNVYWVWCETMATNK